MNQTSPSLAAGDGDLLRLYFGFQSAPVNSGMHTVDIVPFSSFNYDAETVVGSYQPQVTPALLDIRFSIRGDADLSGGISIGDAVFIINYIFAGGPAPSLYNADANSDGNISIGDAVLLINYIFASGPPPAP